MACTSLKPAAEETARWCSLGGRTEFPIVSCPHLGGDRALEIAYNFPCRRPNYLGQAPRSTQRVRAGLSRPRLFPRVKNNMLNGKSLLFALIGVSCWGVAGCSTPTEPTVTRPTVTAPVVSAPCPQVLYTGPHNETVGTVLRQMGYTTACADSQMRLPYGPYWDAISRGTCQRDLYVAASVVHAYGARQYAYQGRPQQAVASAQSMCAELRRVDQLCSSVPTFSADRCPSEDVYACGAGGRPGLVTQLGCP